MLFDRLTDLEVWPARLEAFAANTSHCHALGPGFRGIKTTWERLRGAAALAKMVVDWLGSASARTLLGHAVEIAEAVNATEDCADQLDECGQDFAAVLSQGAAGPCGSLLIQSQKPLRRNSGGDANL